MIKFKNCFSSSLMIEKFEKNVYVDAYELKLKKYQYMFTFYLSNKVNSETAEYKSQDFELFIYINNKIISCNIYEETNSKNITEYSCKILIKVPIHLRYQTVSRIEGAYYNFTIKKPNFYWRDYNDEQNNFENTQNYISKSEINSLELPCEKNASSNNDYLIYMKNYFKNKNNTNMVNISSNSYLYYLVFETKVCKWYEIPFEEVKFGLFFILYVFKLLSI
jgi:hypothetical protein